MLERSFTSTQNSDTCLLHCQEEERVFIVDDLSKENTHPITGISNNTGS